MAPPVSGAQTCVATGAAQSLNWRMPRELGWAKTVLYNFNGKPKNEGIRHAQMGVSKYSKRGSTVLLGHFDLALIARERPQPDLDMLRRHQLREPLAPFDDHQHGAIE